MVATLQSLLTVKTPRENLLGMVTKIAALGFPNTTNWTTGTVPFTLLETIGYPLTDIQQSRFNFAAGGLLDYAALAGRPWLELHADQVFNNQAFPAVAAEVDVEFVDAANQGPFNIGPGGAGVSIGEGQPIYRTTNTTTVVLPLGGSVVIRVRAATPGSSGNVPDGSLRFFAAGRLPGVTVNNPGPNSVKVAGVDAEGNGPLTERCRTKWALLSTGSPVPAYVNWSLYAGQGQVGKVKVRVNTDLSDPGLVRVYLGSPAGGGVTGAVVTAVQNFIAPIDISGARTGSRIPETAKCIVASANPLTVYIKATISVYPEYNNAAFLAQVLADLSAYQAVFPIGGVRQQAVGPGGYLPSSRVTQLLLNRSGVVLDPAQELLNDFLQFSYTGMAGSWFSGAVGLGDLDAMVFNTSNLALNSVPRPV